MNYEEMSDLQINLLVANAVGVDAVENSGVVFGAVKHKGNNVVSVIGVVDYCNNPSDAWPIIVKNKIRISPVMHMSDDNGEYLCDGVWEAGTLWSDDGAFYNSKYNEASNENPLRAAMIVFLMMQESAQ